MGQSALSCERMTHERIRKQSWLERSKNSECRTESKGKARGQRKTSQAS